MAGGRPHTSGAVAVGGTSRAGMRSQAVLAQPSQKGPGWAAALDPRKLPKVQGADVAAAGLALSSLVDDFSDNTVDATRWPNSFGTFSETGGRARVSCDAGFNAFSSALTYRLAESQVSLRVFPPAAGGATTEAWTQILIKQQTNGTDLGFEISPLSGNLTMFSRTGFFDAGAVAITYDPITHAWLRVRETGGNTYWETSPEGLFWTTRRTLASPAWVADPNLEFQLIAHRSDGTNDFAEFDNVNVVHIKEPFDSYSTGSAWSEGSLNGPWQVKFLGMSGQVIPVDVSGEGRTLQLESVDPSSTSSTLVVSTPRTVGDAHWRSRCRTVAQLHGSPAAWEVLWFVWNYEEPTAGTRRFYYVALKTNGIELGKVDQSVGLPGGQRFLWTDGTAFTLGTWYNLEVKQAGANIKVWVDGTLRADFTDGPGSGGTPGWGTAGETVMTSGAVAMYHEDARVQFGDILWVDELAGDASLTGTAQLTADGTAAAGGVSGDASASITAGLSAAGTVAASSGGSLACTAASTAAGTVAAVGAATTTAAAAITAAGTRNAISTASTAPTASLSAAGTVAATGTATATATATTTAAGRTDAAAGAAFTASASLTSAGLRATSSAAAATATANVTAAAAVAAQAAATVSATATVTAAGSVTASGAGSASFAITGTVTAAGLAAVIAGGALTVTAQPTAVGTRGASSLATVTATAGLGAAGTVGARGTTALAASASLGAAGVCATAGLAGVEAVVGLTAAGSIAVVHDDIEVTVGMPYSPWSAGAPQGQPWPASEPQASDWEVATPW